MFFAIEAVLINLVIINRLSNPNIKHIWGNIAINRLFTMKFVEENYTCLKSKLFKFNS